jgi:hypothetical protein
MNRLNSKPEKPQYIYRVFFAFLILVFFIFGIGWYFVNAKISNPETVVTGVFRTSGLSEDEKRKFGLNSVKYQVTDFSDSKKAYQEGEVVGYYLLSGGGNDELLGKCIRVTGSVPQEWKTKNNIETYNRIAIRVKKIEKIDDITCSPYGKTQPRVDDTQEKLIIRGIVTHTNRLAPDMGYDYQLNPTGTFVDEFSAAGSPQKVSFVYITPTTDHIWNAVENTINKEVAVEGYMEWGYAESRYLQITDVRDSSTTEKTQ